MPFQRITRYSLLLKEVLKHTPKVHKDYEYIRIAIKKFETLTTSANERLREDEAAKSVLRVSKLLDPPVQNLARPYRKLVRDGELPSKFYEVNMKLSAEVPYKNCRVFLFNDCLLLTEPHKNIRSIFDSAAVATKFKPLEIVDLHNAVLLDVEKPENEFRVRAPTGLVIFHSKNWPEKEAWIDDISTCINKHNENPTFHKTQSSMLILPPNFLQVPDGRSSRLSQVLPSASAPVSTGSMSNSMRNLHDMVKFSPLTRGNTMNGYNTITRHLTLPRIGIKNIFQRTTLNAPEVEASVVDERRRCAIPRSVSYNSFFTKPKAESKRKSIAKRIRRQSLNDLDRNNR